jgi:hypothetical protein
MNEVPRRALREIIAKHGTDVCSDVRRCEGLLRDWCGAYRREINILVNAAEERVPLDLLAAEKQIPRELLLARLAKRLEEHLALTPEAANWAVESWALALGIMTEAEVAAREKKRAATNDLAGESETQREDRTQKPEQTNFPSSQSVPRQQPRAQQTRPPKINRPPVFYPPPASSAGQTGGALAGRASQTPPVPVGKTAPQQNQPQQTDPTRAVNPRPRKRGWRLRGCFVGCVLLLILLSVLIVGVPYAFRVMRETQQQSQPRFPPQ